MERFHLKVVASDKVFFDGSTEVAIVPALDGEYAFMAHHEALVVAVQPGRLSYKKRGRDMAECGCWQRLCTGGEQPCNRFGRHSGETGGY